MYERMLSGTMYNDLSTELVQRREQVVFLTNDYNSTYGKPKEVREALLRNFVERHWGECSLRTQFPV